VKLKGALSERDRNSQGRFGAYASHVRERICKSGRAERARTERDAWASNDGARECRGSAASRWSVVGWPVWSGSGTGEFAIQIGSSGVVVGDFGVGGCRGVCTISIPQKSADKDCKGHAGVSPLKPLPPLVRRAMLYTHIYTPLREVHTCACIYHLANGQIASVRRSPSVFFSSSLSHSLPPSHSFCLSLCLSVSLSISLSLSVGHTASVGQW